MVTSFFKISRDAAAAEYGRQNQARYARIARTWQWIKIGFWAVIIGALVIATIAHRN